MFRRAYVLPLDGGAEGWRYLGRRWGSARPSAAILARRLGQAHDPRLVAGRVRGSAGDPSRESPVVTVFTSGWKLIRLVRASAPASRTSVTSPRAVVDEPEGRHRAGLDAEDLAQLLGRAEGEPPEAPIASCGRLRSMRGLVLGGDEEEAALLVLDEQVLRVRRPGCPALTDCDSATVKTAGHARRSRCSMPSARGCAKRPAGEVGQRISNSASGAVLEAGPHAAQDGRVNRWRRLARGVPPPREHGKEEQASCNAASIWGT